jgi:hypothetical protein
VTLVPGIYQPPFLLSYEQIWQQTPLLIISACIATILAFIYIERRGRISL